MTRSRERSAGILAYRRGNGIEVLLAHPGGPFWAKRDEGAWSIPKGIVESGDLLACAHREFHEETGLSVNGEAFELQPVRQRNGKIVHGFAIEADLDLSGCHSNSFAMEWPPRSGKMKSFPEVDRVEYFDIDTAMKKIHAYQRPFLIELVRKLRSERD